MEYNRLIETIEQLLEKTKFAVLATSNKEGIVSACQMCLVNDGLILYFQTDKSFEKTKNINVNPNVAINIGAYSFKGIAKILDHPSKSDSFIKKIKEKHPQTYTNYTNLPNEVLIKVELTDCKIWGGIDSKNIHNEDIVQIIDFRNKTAIIITCNKM